MAAFIFFSSSAGGKHVGCLHLPFIDLFGIKNVLVGEFALQTGGNERRE